MEIEEGKTYIVRMYVHNDNPRGLDAIAKDVMARFLLLDMPNNEEKIVGYISSSNATPSKVRHSILLRSVDGRPFTLGYIAGLAMLENNVFNDETRKMINSIDGLEDAIGLYEHKTQEISNSTI